MEKYSKFNDPFTGINPFLNPKYKKINFFTVILAFLKFPLFLLFLLGFNTLPYLIKIKLENKSYENLRGVIFCNKVSVFDIYIIKYLFNCEKFVYFPERANSNNKGILRYSGKSNFSIGLRYSNECIFLYGNYFKWLIVFLGNTNYVYVNIKKDESLESCTGLNKLNLDFKDKEEFMKLVNK